MSSHSSKVYTIEKPALADALELAHMHNQSWYETYPDESHGITPGYIKELIEWRISEKGIKARTRAIQLSYDKPTYFLRIARDQSGKIVGFIDGRDLGDRYSLDGLYTLKETYGTGLGMQLWEAFLPLTNRKTISLTVASYNERAKSFYRKLGFNEIPGSERMYKDTRLPIIDMEKRALHS